MSKKETPWGEIGYIVYKRTYSRKMGKIKTEEYPDTIERVISGANRQLKVGFTKKEEEILRHFLTSLKGTVAGRFFWQLGTKTVDTLGLASLQNCALVVVDHPIRPFTWAMDMLMLGSGVGYNIQREYVYELPKIIKKVKIERKDTNDADFIVPDSREGWIMLLERTLEASFITGKGFTYSTVCIRGKGEVISGFGGTASGPNILCSGMFDINKVLNNRSNKKLRPIDCLDIMNIIGSIVVAGNVRRSAQIAIGDMDDLQYLNAKNWGSGAIPSWRAMSNNSVVCNDISQLPEQFWEGYLGNGEPYGLINLKLSREMGRTGETQYPDLDVVGFNPCAEQSLANFETCCLAEIHLPNIESEEELKEVSTYLYRINKHSLNLPCHHPETEAIVHKNMRMGIGITGFAMATKKQKSWLSKTYKYLREFDVQYSKKHGFNESIKLTTVKPSGTLSLLSGVTPGAHPGFSHFYIRRVRMDVNSPLVQVCREAGYPVEFVRNFDGTNDTNTVVIEFPAKLPKNAVVASEVTAIDQLETIKELQTIWSDNAVSVTIYYKKEELVGIKKWLVSNYNNSLKTVSFLLHSDHGFDQAPMEEITEEEYKKRKKNTKPITNCEVSEDSISSDQIGCVSGACPIK